MKKQTINLNNSPTKRSQCEQSCCRHANSSFAFAIIFTGCNGAQKSGLRTLFVPQRDHWVNVHRATCWIQLMQYTLRNESQARGRIRTAAWLHVSLARRRPFDWARFLKLDRSRRSFCIQKTLPDFKEARGISNH